MDASVICRSGVKQCKGWQDYSDASDHGYRNPNRWYCLPQSDHDTKRDTILQLITRNLLLPRPIQHILALAAITGCALPFSGMIISIQSSRISRSGSDNNASTAGKCCRCTVMLRFIQACRTSPTKSACAVFLPMGFQPLYRQDRRSGSQILHISHFDTAADDDFIEWIPVTARNRCRIERNTLLFAVLAPPDVNAQSSPLRSVMTVLCVHDNKVGITRLTLYPSGRCKTQYMFRAAVFQIMRFAGLSRQGADINRFTTFVLLEDNNPAASISFFIRPSGWTIQIAVGREELASIILMINTRINPILENRMP